MRNKSEKVLGWNRVFFFVWVLLWSTSQSSGNDASVTSCCVSIEALLENTLKRKEYREQFQATVKELQNQFLAIKEGKDQRFWTAPQNMCISGIILDALSSCLYSVHLLGSKEGSATASFCLVLFVSSFPLFSTSYSLVLVLFCLM